jgi:hypothetical protein
MRRGSLCITLGRGPLPLPHRNISPSNMIHRACRPKSCCRSDVPLAVNALLRPLLSSLSIRCRRNQHQQHQHRRRLCPWKATRSLNGAVRRPMQRYRCAATLVHRGCNVKTTDNATASGLDHRSTSAVACEPILRAKHAKLAGDLRRLARAPGAAAVGGEKTGAVDRGQLVLGGHCDDQFSMDSVAGGASHRYSRRHAD